MEVGCLWVDGGRAANILLRIRQRATGGYSQKCGEHDGDRMEEGTGRCPGMDVDSTLSARTVHSEAPDTMTVLQPRHQNLLFSWGRRMNSIYTCHLIYTISDQTTDLTRSLLVKDLLVATEHDHDASGYQSPPPLVLIWTTPLRRSGVAIT